MNKKKCEMFGCPREPEEMYRSGPGAVLYVCKECAERLRKEDDRC